MAMPRYSRRYKRFFFTLFTAFSLVMTGVSVLTGYRHLTAGQATAQIVDVQQARSTLYTVKFVTEDGRPCEGVLSSTESPEHPVDSWVTISYDSPCLNVW